MSNVEIALVGIVVALVSAIATALLTLHYAGRGKVTSLVCDLKHADITKAIEHSMASLEDQISGLKEDVKELRRLWGRLEALSNSTERLLTTIEDHERRMNRLEGERRHDS